MLDCPMCNKRWQDNGADCARDIGWEKSIWLQDHLLEHSINDFIKFILRIEEDNKK